MRFEWNDLRALITVVNVSLIIKFGLVVSWFGLTLAIFGIFSDINKRRTDETNFRWNSVVIHGMNMILNLYFLSLL